MLKSCLIKILDQWSQVPLYPFYIELSTLLTSAGSKATSTSALRAQNFSCHPALLSIASLVECKKKLLSFPKFTIVYSRFSLYPTISSLAAGSYKTLCQDPVHGAAELEQWLKAQAVFSRGPRFES